MHDYSHRAAVATLLLAGLLTAVSPLILSGGAGFEAGSLSPVVLHGQLLVTVLGLGLVLAAFVPQLRLAVASAAIVSKAAFLVLTVGQRAPVGLSQWVEAVQLLLLVPAAAVLACEAWQHARWERVLPSRQET